MGYQLERQTADEIFNCLKQDYDIFAPKLFAGEGCFSDTDVIRYGKVESLDEIFWSRRSDYSFKEAFLPVNEVLFYFTADGRIDFRELVKDLAAVFKTRIELRQIGVRDETKILGGIGICGRPLCCHSYLSEFAPVSIKMAKEQNLSLNPAKISGVCGRLMCCLKNEQETYEYLNRKLPALGDTVITPDGIKGEVHSVNVLRQLVKVMVNINDEKELREYPVDELKFRLGGKKGKGKPAKKEQSRHE